MDPKIGKVCSVSKKSTHEFSKEIQEKVRLITMHGVDGMLMQENMLNIDLESRRTQRS